MINGDTSMFDKKKKKKEGAERFICPRVHRTVEGGIYQGPLVFRVTFRPLLFLRIQP